MSVSSGNIEVDDVLQSFFTVNGPRITDAAHEACSLLILIFIPFFFPFKKGWEKLITIDFNKSWR